jgi:DICT domain-containing protein/signal transduction histidine kinase
MQQSTSLLQDLVQSLPELKVRLYFKAALTALSHAIEDLVLDGNDRPLVIANFQQERFYRQETQRYQRIADKSDHVYVLAVPETAFIELPVPYATIGLDPADELAQEWHLVVVSDRYCAALICREYAAPVDTSALDTARQFRGFWTFDPTVSRLAAAQLLQRVVRYRPDLGDAIAQAKRQYQLPHQLPTAAVVNSMPSPQLRSSLSDVDIQLFSDRLVTYLQASQYKQVKAYRRVVEQERQERLLNQISSAVRQSLQLEDVLTVAVREVGRFFGQCRCLLYQTAIRTSAAVITGAEIHTATSAGRLSGLKDESTGSQMPGLPNANWSLANHPLFELLLQQGQIVAIADVMQDSGIQAHPLLRQQLAQSGIQACLLVPICYQQRCLAVLELHRAEPHLWSSGDRDLLSAIANSVGLALIQAEAYVNMSQLNQQLAEIEQAQNNLIAIVGHELRTPLSTIQVCLESMADEPDMPKEFQQVMLDTALEDSERLRKLVQDFLLLSRLEGNLINWHMEPIDLSELITLALNGLQNLRKGQNIPTVTWDLPLEPLIVICDGEALQQLLNKLLDNACKFTPATGAIHIKAQLVESSPGDSQPAIVAIEIADTGCGIEAKRLETIFERFYQEEGFLQRSVGGTGLGLAICRQLSRRLGGRLWATSAGKGQGSQFHLTLPVAKDEARV